MNALGRGKTSTPIAQVAWTGPALAMEPLPELFCGRQSGRKKWGARARWAAP